MKSIPPANLRRVCPRILITGGCGFIGANLAHAVASRGQQVLILDSLGRAGAQENASWLKARHRDQLAIEVGDVRDESAVRELVLTATAVLHLAAQVAVTTSLEDPINDFDVNARGTLNVLEAVRRHNPTIPLIFASTNKVYGRVVAQEQLRATERRYLPADQSLRVGVGEQAPLDLYSPYGCSKGAADQYVRDYARVFALRTVVLRMSCIYGQRQFGTEDQGWIAHFLLRAMAGEPITVYGDGRQVRDALFIDDAVAAWLRVLDRIDQVVGRVFNLGGGPENAVSLREMLELIAELRGNRPEVRHASWRPGDQLWYVSDVRAIAAALDWGPRVALPDGLRGLERWLASRRADPPRSRLREASL